MMTRKVPVKLMARVERENQVTYSLRTKYPKMTTKNVALLLTIATVVKSNNLIE